MATTFIEINNETWTEVLTGEGFVVSSTKVQYAFNASNVITAYFTVPADEPVHGGANDTLYAKSPMSGPYTTVNVASSPKT